MPDGRASLRKVLISSGWTVPWEGLSLPADWFPRGSTHQHRQDQTFGIPLGFHVEALIPTCEIVENTDNQTD